MTEDACGPLTCVSSLQAFVLMGVMPPPPADLETRNRGLTHELAMARDDVTRARADAELYALRAMQQQSQKPVSVCVCVRARVCVYVCGGGEGGEREKEREREKPHVLELMQRLMPCAWRSSSHRSRYVVSKGGGVVVAVLWMKLLHTRLVAVPVRA